MATLVKRVSRNSEFANYRDTMTDFLETEQLRIDFIDRLPVAASGALEFRNYFIKKYSFLWTLGTEAVLEQFLTYGTIVARNVNEDNDSFCNLAERGPTLKDFKDKVRQFNYSCFSCSWF